MTVFASGSGTSLGQSLEKGAISGTIFDPSGAVVPGADVTVINTSTGAERVLISNEAGRFRADILPAGEYLIEIYLAGFATMIVEGVENLPINGRDFRDFANLSPTADTTPGLRSPVRSRVRPENTRG